MRLMLCVCLVSLLPVPVAAEELKIACWNLENLFDEFLNRQTPDEDLFLQTEVEEKLRKDAEVIKLLDADIIGLVEVENRTVLKRLARTHLQEAGYRYITVIENDSPRGIDCAIMSRRPFLAQNFSVEGFDREIMAARFSINGEPLYVLVNHWKSRLGGGEEQRMNCAKAVAELVNKTLPEYEGRPVAVVVMGDLNDQDTDASVLHLETAGLTNTLKELDWTKRWTIPYFDADQDKMLYQGFDHLLINDVLKNGTTLRWLSSEVVKPKQLITTRRINRVDRLWLNDDTDDVIGYSDHLPVLMRVEVLPAVPAE